MCDAENISCQSFAYVCAHSLQAEAACVALGTSNGIKTFIHEDLTLFSLLYQSSFPSSVPQYFLSESIQFRSLLAPVVRDNGPVWPLMRPSFPLQLQKPLPSNRHCCSPSYANTLILHSQLLWKALALFFLLLQSVRLDGIIFNLYFSLLNNSFKKSTFHGEYMCIICWLVLALLFIYINIYI